MQRHTKQKPGGGQANWGWTLATALALSAQIVPAVALARPAGIVPTADAGDDNDDGDALPYRQCVPFAREASGITLFGDAHTWWDQAEGRYARGRSPKAGAVMSFRPHGAMTLGHVAMVSRVIDDRTVLLRHANWSLIEGRRGNVELDVRAVDVSPTNDWSEVRVWYAPIGDLGTTRWPVNGFIYKYKPRLDEGLLPARDAVLASADSQRLARLTARAPTASRIDANFLVGIPPEPGTTPVLLVHTWLVARPQVQAAASPARMTPVLRDDPIGRIIAARMKPRA